MNRIEPCIARNCEAVFLGALPSATAAPSVDFLSRADAVEISDEASGLSMASQAKPRFALITRIRDEIEHQSFETPERIEGTVERLLELVEWAR